MVISVRLGINYIRMRLWCALLYYRFRISMKQMEVVGFLGYLFPQYRPMGKTWLHFCSSSYRGNLRGGSGQ